MCFRRFVRIRKVVYNMLIYGDFEKEERPKLSLESVRYLSERLNEFVQIYEKKVYLENPKDKETLRQLKIIADLLKQERYDQLIVDPNMVIDFTDAGDGYLPDYYPI